MYYQVFYERNILLPKVRYCCFYEKQKCRNIVPVALWVKPLTSLLKPFHQEKIGNKYCHVKITYCFSILLFSLCVYISERKRPSLLTTQVEKCSWRSWCCYKILSQYSTSHSKCSIEKIPKFSIFIIFWVDYSLSRVQTDSILMKNMKY